MVAYAYKWCLWLVWAHWFYIYMHGSWLLWQGHGGLPLVTDALHPWEDMTLYLQLYSMQVSAGVNINIV
jgi:hypothetical protein